MPKQFYPLLDRGTLFEMTIKRNMAFTRGCMIAANRDHAFLAFGQLEAMGIAEKAGLLEPVGRNTAPAIALCAMKLGADDVMLVCPSDHLVLDERSYREAVERAVELARGGRLVVFGAEPAYPETGFGYIEHDGESVVSFHEKPERERAEKYCESRRFLWNIGMFCFKAGAFLAELERHSPDLYRACAKVRHRCGNQALMEPTIEEMNSLSSISIDYAVMEKSDIVSVVPCEIGWSDLGSFDSLYPIAFDSAKKNSVLAETDPLFLDSSGNLVIGRGEKKIVLIDVSDLTVVDTEDALLIARKGAGQKVKEAVDILKAQDAMQLRAHPENVSEWGTCSILFETDNVQVKRLAVLPGMTARLVVPPQGLGYWQHVEGEGVVLRHGRESAIHRDDRIQLDAGETCGMRCSGASPLIVIETSVRTKPNEA